MRVMASDERIVVVVLLAAVLAAATASASVPPRATQPVLDRRVFAVSPASSQSPSEDPPLPILDEATFETFDAAAHVDLPPADAAALIAAHLESIVTIDKPASLALFAVSPKRTSGLFASLAENHINGEREFARARWFDPNTGSFLSPDPEGYGDSSNLYAFCGGDPVNCSDPRGERAMTGEDRQRLAMLKARGKKLYDDFTTTGRGSFMQPMRVNVDRAWHDTSGIPGGDYETQMVTATVTTQESYELAKRTMVNDIATFQVAVARADADGEIYYVPGQGFTTVTAADARRARTTTIVAAGVFFTTDTLPMIFSPARLEPVEEIGGIQVPRSEVARFKGVGAKANRDRGNAWRDEIADTIRAQGGEARTEVEKDTPFGPRFIDVEVGPVDDPLGGIEAKEGNSRYKPDQRSKDEWLRRQKYPVHLLRKPPTGGGKP